MSINSRPRVLPDSCVRVVRKIKGSGQLSVSKNQEISPHDVIGSSLINPGFVIINLAKELGVSPDTAISCLKKTSGIPIYKGELLARKKTLFKDHTVLSPTDCMIEKINLSTGELTLKMLPKQTPLLSGVFGIVDEINPLTGEVYIKTMATQIVGLYGSGRERGGFIRIINDASGLTDIQQITPNLKGDIVVAGGLIFDQAIKKAMEYQLDGLISGGINFDDYLSIAGSYYFQKQTHSDIGLSLVATEGFGPLPLGNDIFTILKNSEGKFAFIDGFNNHITLPQSSADSVLKARKVALPPLLNRQKDYHDQISIKPPSNGDLVRVIWPPFAGSQGKIVSIDQTPTILPSGISSICAVVELPSRKQKYPISNLELLENR